MEAIEIDPVERRRRLNAAAVKKYVENHAAEVRARKALWYQLNKENRRKVQKAYRDRSEDELQAEALAVLAKVVR